MNDRATPSPPAWVARARVVVLLAPAMAALGAGIWGGLVRIGWDLPGDRADLVRFHGPLLVVGFLGTLIGLERAVALRRLWGFAAPAGTIAGCALVLFGDGADAGRVLLLAAAVVLLAVLLTLGARTVRHRPARPPSGLLVLAAAQLVAGNALWLGGFAVADVVPWWSGFLILTIVAERLELTALTGLAGRRIRVLLGLVGMQVIGLVAGLADAGAGARVVGAAFLGTAVWLGRHDVARRTIRLRGLPRYAAVALVSGYVWLAFAGVLGVVRAAEAGTTNDARLHAVFLGFVFSMIFAHAPIVFPALLGVAIPFRRIFYAHLGLMHAGLLLRTVGDLAGERDLARAGAIAGAVAIGLFVVATAGSAALGRRAPRAAV